MRPFLERVDFDHLHFLKGLFKVCGLVLGLRLRLGMVNVRGKCFGLGMYCTCQVTLELRANG